MLIARTGSKYCPVAYLEKFLQLAKLDVNNDGAAFVIPRLFKTKHGYTASKTAGISYTSATELFNRNIQIVTEKERKYAFHSLRAGGASAAANHGLSDRLISKQGRWAPEGGRNRHIEDSTANRLQVTRCLGL